MSVVHSLSPLREYAEIDEVHKTRVEGWTERLRIESASVLRA